MARESAAKRLLCDHSASAGTCAAPAASITSVLRRRWDLRPRAPSREVPADHAVAAGRTVASRAAAATRSRDSAAKGSTQTRGDRKKVEPTAVAALVDLLKLPPVQPERDPAVAKQLPQRRVER